MAERMSNVLLHADSFCMKTARLLLTSVVKQMIATSPLDTPALIY